MISKLVLLLGALTGAFIAYLCVQNNKGLLTSLEKPLPVQSQIQTPREEAATETPPIPDEAIAYNPPSFIYENTPEEHLALHAGSTDKTEALLTKIAEYCQEPQCKTELDFAENTDSAETWQENVLQIVAFFQKNNIRNASVKIEKEILAVKGDFPDQESLDAFKTLLASFSNTPLKIEENLNLSIPEAQEETAAEENIKEPAPETEPEPVTPEVLQDIQTEVKPVQTKKDETKVLEDVQQKNILKMQDEITSLLKTHPIYFQTNSNELTLDSKKLLDKIIDLVNRNSEEIAKLRILGHTDASGPAEYNKLLSQKRAEKVRDYLTEHHIKVPTLEATGYGEERPISQNPHAKENRRVEIEIIKEANHD